MSKKPTKAAGKKPSKAATKKSAIDKAYEAGREAHISKTKFARVDILALKRYIVVANVIPEALCDHLLDEYTNSGEWQNTFVGDGRVDMGVRNCHTIPLSNAQLIGRNQQKRQELDHAIFECAGRALKAYMEKFPDCNVAEDTGYEMLRYLKDGYYHQHTDSFLRQPRALSCSFALNDNYEGGEFGFFNAEYKIKARKGAAVMFPSNYMFPHEIMKVTKGTRYSIITWFR